MSEEEKAETTPAPEQSEKKVDAEETSKEGNKKEEASNIDNQIDYKAMAEEERKAREKAEKALAADRYKASKEKREEDVEEEEGEKPLTASELETILARERQATQKDLEATRISELASSLATSDDEAALIVEIHKGRTFPSHLSLEDQLEESLAIANRKKLVGERNEALRALKSKSSAGDSAASTHHDPPKANEPQLSAGDKQAITAVGFSWNATSRRYEKKLANGDILVRDQKTKQTSVVKAK